MLYNQLVGRHKKMDDIVPLFVYGSLLDGEANHNVMQELIQRGHAKLADPHAILEDYVLCDIGGLPAAYPVWKERPEQDGIELDWEEEDIGPRSVSGELYQLTAAGYAVLDIFEGSPRFYSRVLGKLRGGGRCCVYQGPQAQRRYPWEQRFDGVRVLYNMDGWEIPAFWPKRLEHGRDIAMQSNGQVIDEGTRMFIEEKLMEIDEEFFEEEEV